MKETVLGGSQCGLATAWESARNGVKITVVEKDAEVGGLRKTVKKNGYRFDLGSQRFISKDVELVNYIRHINF